MWYQCETCGELTENAPAPDPYVNDIFDNPNVIVVLCDTCLQARVDDI